MGERLEAICDDSLSCDGPLFAIDGDDIAFNGTGCSFDVSTISLLYTNGGVDKPHPFLKFKGSGTYSDFMVFNNPTQAISIGNSDGFVSRPVDLRFAF
ncbi:hypothetical protein F5146DRAFT_1139890 [Armillaria mellea]|nr:hypothetical protein F5146DRAFT_1139890 [Armillaria mellea]